MKKKLTKQTVGERGKIKKMMEKVEKDWSKLGISGIKIGKNIIKFKK